MPNPKTPRAGRPHLQRDNQQWILDYLIKETGKVFHFQGDGRGNLPRSVRSHSMISKHVGQAARRTEARGDMELAAGHPQTALGFYFKAQTQYHSAQHVIFENNDEKRYLYSGVRRCFDRVIELSPYRIEHVDIPWNGTLVSGNLHLCPGLAKAPCVFYIAGCDQNKENWPHPLFNQAHQRGMHAFSFDGPGQGESNLRDIPLSADNYEQAASTAIDYLAQRPEIDPEQIVVYGISFGSFWAMRTASFDHRVRAVAGPNASYCDKYFILNEESPRWKQLFGYLTRSTTEEELDRVADGLTMNGYMAKIECPALLVAGEYDPRSPIEELYRLFDQFKVPAELWVYADAHHNPSVGGEGGVTWEAPVHGVMCDWLKDRLAGKPLAHPGQVVYVEASSPGPYSPAMALKRRWYER